MVEEEARLLPGDDVGAEAQAVLLKGDGAFQRRAGEYLARLQPVEEGGLRGDVAAQAQHEALYRQPVEQGVQQRRQVGNPGGGV